MRDWLYRSPAARISYVRISGKLRTHGLLWSVMQDGNHASSGEILSEETHSDGRHVASEGSCHS